MITIELTEVPSVRGAFVSALRPMATRPRALSGPPIRDRRLRTMIQDEDKLHEYQRICGFPHLDIVPATWLHVLTFPLQMHIMADKDWPFPMMGAVHVANTMTQFRPVSVREELDVHVLPGNFKPHEKGATFDLTGIIKVGKEPVWTGRSTYLVKGYELPGEKLAIKQEKLPDADPIDTWEAPVGLGQQYAKVSGDFNPIHLHNLSAKLFGFPSAIAHGMWTHARALAAYGEDLPDSFEARAQFAKPVKLPSKPRFVRDGNKFGVIDKNGKPHLAGSINEAESFDGRLI